MVKLYKANDLNKRCQIGNIKTVKTPTGGSKRDLDDSTAVTIWYGAKMRSLGLQFALTSELRDTFEIVVRHHERNKSATGVKFDFDDKVYNIINVSPDDTANLEAFDFLTLQKTTKGT